MRSQRATWPILIEIELISQEFTYLMWSQQLYYGYNSWSYNLNDWHCCDESTTMISEAWITAYLRRWKMWFPQQMLPIVREAWWHFFYYVLSSYVGWLYPISDFLSYVSKDGKLSKGRITYRWWLILVQLSLEQIFKDVWQK